MKPIIALVIVLCACGKTQGSDAKADKVSEVAARVESISQFAPTCDGYVSKGDCDQGDVMLFSGLLCLSGNQVGCDTAQRSIGPDGRVWRSPKAVGIDNQNSSSRDMFLGAMAYFAGTRDIDGLQKVTAYINANGRICPDATDGRCNMTDNTKWALYQLQAFYGLPANSRKGYSESLALAATSAPEGYGMHLVAVQLLILKKTGTWNSTLQFAANELTRRQSRNVFFEVLAHGKTDRWADDMLEQAPVSKPETQSQWSIERKTSEASWRQSMLWEFIFVNAL